MCQANLAVLDVYPFTKSYPEGTFVYPFHIDIHIFVVRAMDKGLTLETSAFLTFTVANLRFQLNC